MSVKLELKDEILTVNIGIKRIDGGNNIFNHIISSENITQSVEKIIFNMEKVEYINSLGIAEFISIHRYFTSLNEGKTHFTFINLDKKIYAIMQLVEISKLADLFTK